MGGIAGEVDRVANIHFKEMQAKVKDAVECAVERRCQNVSEAVEYAVERRCQNVTEAVECAVERRCQSVLDGCKQHVIQTIFEAVDCTVDSRFKYLELQLQEFHADPQQDGSHHMVMKSISDLQEGVAQM